MSEPHAMTGLYAGDYFIHRFNFGGQVFYAYGLLRHVDDEGKYYADYQCSQPPSRPTDVATEDHRVVGRISRRAYLLARLRSWPNSDAAAAAIIDFSAGKPTNLSLREKLLLFFVR